MKKIIKILLSLILLVSLLRVKAETMEITYSEWSTDYPSGLDEYYIESEKRYNWYKIVDNKIEYIDEYYKELDGYIKDESSERTYYRYITNPYIFVSGYNEIVTNPYEYCEKSACFFIRFTTPTMVDTLSKENSSKHDISKAIEIKNTVVPYTKDNILNYFILFGISTLLLVTIIILKRKKLSRKF